MMPDFFFPQSIYSSSLINKTMTAAFGLVALMTYRHLNIKIFLGFWLQDTKPFLKK